MQDRLQGPVESELLDAGGNLCCALPSDGVKLAFWNKSYKLTTDGTRALRVANSPCMHVLQLISCIDMPKARAREEVRPKGTEQNTTCGTQHKKHKTEHGTEHGTLESQTTCGCPDRQTGSVRRGSSALLHRQRPCETCLLHTRPMRNQEVA